MATEYYLRCATDGSRWPEGGCREYNLHTLYKIRDHRKEISIIHKAIPELDMSISYMYDDISLAEFCAIHPECPMLVFDEYGRKMGISSGTSSRLMGR